MSSVEDVAFEYLERAKKCLDNNHSWNETTLLKIAEIYALLSISQQISKLK